ncbi:MAG: leucine-rich repeat domain-containing protein [Bacteroidetes bacterium]|nr:MAG: leucine-rich repeat domain-containing protein [Bacteroidota bacterium]
MENQISIIENSLAVKLKRVTEREVLHTPLSYSCLENQEIIGLNLMNVGGKGKAGIINFSNPRFNLPYLKILNISGNNINNTDGFVNMENLTHLDVSNNQITNMNCLQKMQDLVYLDVSRNKIRSIKISKQKKIVFLNISRNHIHNLSVSCDLKILLAQHNDIENIESIEGTENLTDLSLSHNKIKNITILERFLNLENINLYSNQIIDISVLEKLKKLKNINLNQNKIQDTSMFKYFKGIEDVKILKIMVNPFSKNNNMPAYLYKEIGLDIVDYFIGNDNTNDIGLSSEKTYTKNEWKEEIPEAKYEELKSEWREEIQTVKIYEELKNEWYKIALEATLLEIPDLFGKINSSISMLSKDDQNKFWLLRGNFIDMPVGESFSTWRTKLCALLQTI